MSDIRNQVLTAAAFLTVGIAIVSPEIWPHSGLNWLALAGIGVLVLPVAFALALLVRLAVIVLIDRVRDRKAVRTAPTGATGIQALGTFIDDSEDGVR